MQPRNQQQQSIDPQFLLTAYCSGYFPMADSETGAISWYSPDPRTIFELNEFRIPRSLKLTIKKHVFDIRINQQFEEVMRGCADRAETWISEPIIRSYVALHRMGFGHSVETWRDGSLVGGLYGVAINGAFFGESMFSRERDASKVALAYLVERLCERRYSLLDTQYLTPHLARFGAKEIPREEYLHRLEQTLQQHCTFI
ncbi:MAG TPA: leucyl/phenylalanyl-tRNA--protein transferase [Bacteroidota bacterium]|nr:leucyl/phenylalanyl-tRNA--protein transferase [Bacteroidota bacterium]